MNSGRKQHYSIWVDGSAYSPKQKELRIGAGWVVRNDDTGEIKERIRLMADTKSGSSMVAEFNAAAYALRSLPAGSCVILHTDSLGVKNYLTEGRLPKMNSSSDHTRAALETASQFLWSTQIKHTSLSIAWKDGAEDRRQLRQAHKLARIAASLSATVAP